MAEDALPEPDRLEGTPHPRDTVRLIGQGAAEANFLEAFNSDRLHHAWLITGPKGVGKATLAWRIARFLLTQEPPGAGLFGDAPVEAVSLDVSPEHPVVQRMEARSEPRLFHITRSMNPDTKRMRDVIVVDDVRALGHFLSMSAAEGGRRVVILDSADELNVQAANALLKMLEEPPKLTTFLMVAHQPAGLLPTIRSRCRELRVVRLEGADMAEALMAAGLDVPAEAEALAVLAGGSVGAAARLIELEGLALYGELVEVLGTLPRPDRARVQQMAERYAARGQDERLELFITLLETLMFRLALAGAGGVQGHAHAGEAALFSKLAPDMRAAREWARLSEELMGRVRHGRAVNLDAAALILDTFLRLQKSVSELAHT